MDQITLHPIGILHCSLTSSKQTPKSFEESAERGILEIDEAYLKGIDGIEPGDTIVVLFWFHRADRTLLTIHPRGDKTRPKRGVFSTRSPTRPNPIAVSKLKVTAVVHNKIYVIGVDAFDKTPVLDIKNTLSGNHQ